MIDFREYFLAIAQQKIDIRIHYMQHTKGHN